MRYPRNPYDGNCVQTPFFFFFTGKRNEINEETSALMSKKETGYSETDII